MLGRLTSQDPWEVRGSDAQSPPPPFSMTLPQGQASTEGLPALATPPNVGKGADAALLSPELVGPAGGYRALKVTTGLDVAKEGQASVNGLPGVAFPRRHQEVVKE